MAITILDTYATNASNAAASLPNQVSVINDGTGNEQVMALSDGSATIANVVAGDAGFNGVATASATLDTTFTTTGTGAQILGPYNCKGYSWVTIHYVTNSAGGFTHSAQFSQSSGGTFQSASTFQNIGSGGVPGAITSNPAANSYYAGPVIDNYFQLNVTAITSGSVSGTITFSNKPSVLTATTAAQSGTFTVNGTKTNNNAAPLATNVGAMTEIANAAQPSWTEGNLVLQSTDLKGNTRMRISDAAGNDRGANVDANGNLQTAGTDYPDAVSGNATAITATSGNVANASAVATLAAASGKLTYITGFELTGSGAVAGSPVIVTVTGTVSGTLSYIYSAIAGVLLENTPLIVQFPKPIPSSATNTAIVVTCPALGTGNTNNVVNAHGYQM